MALKVEWDDEGKTPDHNTSLDFYEYRLKPMTEDELHKVKVSAQKYFDYTEAVRVLPKKYDAISYTIESKLKDVSLEKFYGELSYVIRYDHKIKGWNGERQDAILRTFTMELVVQNTGDPTYVVVRVFPKTGHFEYEYTKQEELRAPKDIISKYSKVRAAIAAFCKNIIKKIAEPKPKSKSRSKSRSRSRSRSRSKSRSP